MSVKYVNVVAKYSVRQHANEFFLQLMSIIAGSECNLLII